MSSSASFSQMHFIYDVPLGQRPCYISVEILLTVKICESVLRRELYLHGRKENKYLYFVENLGKFYLGV
jgi:hypothetical protein